MSKNLPDRERRRKTTKRNRDVDEADDDPLGKLLQNYQVQFGNVLVACGMLASVGLAIVGYGLFQKPHPVLLLVIGGGLVLAAFVMLLTNAINMGRRLELRKYGVRYVQPGNTTELMWDDIVEIEVNRQDDINLGIATAHKRSSDAVSSSGLLTKTEWSVILQSRDGEQIHLRPSFLKTVADPRELISQLKRKSGR